MFEWDIPAMVPTHSYQSGPSLGLSTVEVLTHIYEASSFVRSNHYIIGRIV